MNHRWYEIENVDEVPSPSLLVYPDKVEANIRYMIELAGDAGRLRPHIKTHKTPELIRLQLKLGITKFKCATLAEAEMAANAGAKDILIAYQLVGPNIGRFLSLCRSFPAVHFSCVVDDAAVVAALSAAATEARQSVSVYLDINVGQNRTGIVSGAQARHLYGLIAGSPSLEPAGLHVYDGHIHGSNVTERLAACDAAFGPVETLRHELELEGLPVPNIVAGGTPTFPFHARRPNVECSPGTCILWDAGYAHTLPDLHFVPAAVLITRIVSKPTPSRLCLDLGHKAVASEMAHPRVVFCNVKDVTPVVHSEEHLVLETPNAQEFSVGDILYGIPWHICPTVALHREIVVVRNGRAEGRWQVKARDRALTI